MTNDVYTYEIMQNAMEHYENTNNEFILRALFSEDESIVWFAARICGLKRLPASIPRLIQIIGNECRDLGDTNVRRISTWSLAQIGLESVLEYYEDVYKDSNWLIREGIADMLGMCHYSDLVLNILKVLMNDPDEKVCLWASLSLSKHGEHSLLILSDQLNKQKNPKIIIYILDALCKISTEESLRVADEYVIKTDNSQIKLLYDTIRTSDALLK